MRRATAELCSNAVISGGGSFDLVHKISDEEFARRHSTIFENHADERLAMLEEVRAYPDTSALLEHVWTHSECPNATLHLIGRRRQDGRFTNLDIFLQLGPEFRHFASETILIDAIWRATKNNYTSVTDGHIQMVRGCVPIHGRDGLSVLFVGLVAPDYLCDQCNGRGSPLSPVNISVALYEQIL